VNETDLQLELPQHAPDPTDSVVVLQMDGPVKGSKGRLLATNVKQNQLLAFDADAHGKFTYGDGKAGRYYAQGFNDADDHLSWSVRTNANARFNVSVRYRTETSAKLTVQVGEQTVSADAVPSKDSKGIDEVSLGTITIPAGARELRLKPEKPVELSVFEVVLEPRMQGGY